MSDVRAARLLAQGLTLRDATTPEQVVGRLLAVQAQDLRAARLAVRSRTTGVGAADVDAALTDRRTLVVAWLNRGTLHLVAAADYPWLHALTAPSQAAGNERRLRQEGVSPEQAEVGARVVGDALRDEGPLSRDALRERLTAEGVPTAGQALVHVLLRASIAGRLIRGPVDGREQLFVDPGAWLGPAAPVDRDTALARLGARYLAGHAPSGARDLATWAGIPLTDARRALAGAAPGAVHGSAGMPAPVLLGGFDPILHGWASREPFVGAHRGVVTTNGVFRPTALVDGRVVATWGLAGGVVTIRPLERIGARALQALKEDGGGVLRFLGLPPRPPVLEATPSTGPGGP